MSVQSGLLAVLSLGPAYGSQLQAELLARAAHRGRLNSGQVYKTLERLADRGLVATAGLTDDGLPLYTLTARGERDVRSWLHEAQPGTPPDWDEMLDQVLVATSIAGADPLAIVDGYRKAWHEAIAALPEASTALENGSIRAVRLRAEAALAWLAETKAAFESSPDAFALDRAASRPRRGRPAR